MVSTLDKSSHCKRFLQSKQLWWMKKLERLLVSYLDSRKCWHGSPEIRLKIDQVSSTVITRSVLLLLHLYARVDQASSKPFCIFIQQIDNLVMPIIIQSPYEIGLLLIICYYRSIIPLSHALLAFWTGSCPQLDILYPTWQICFSLSALPLAMMVSLADSRIQRKNCQFHPQQS